MTILDEEKKYGELKKALKWWIAKEMILKKFVWFKKVNN